MSDDSDHNEGFGTVGYGKPPTHSRFKPGQSGNPRGRPKGARGLKAELKAELDEMVTISVEGRPRRIRKRRLILKALAAKAMKGDVKAADKMLSLSIQAEGFEDERAAIKPLSDTDRLILDQFLGIGVEDAAPPASDESEADVTPGDIAALGGDNA